MILEATTIKIWAVMIEGQLRILVREPIPTHNKRRGRGSVVNEGYVCIIIILCWI
jgi:hypothetical protein